MSRISKERLDEIRELYSLEDIGICGRPRDELTAITELLSEIDDLTDALLDSEVVRKSTYKSLLYTEKQNQEHLRIHEAHLERIKNLKNEKDGLYADLIDQEHLMGSKIEVLEAGNRKLEAQNSKLLTHLQQCDNEYLQLIALREENNSLYADLMSRK